MTDLATTAWLRAALEHPPAARIEVGTNRASAVLVPVLRRPDGPTVLFVRKSTQLNRHAGQIGFPGGAVDPEDADLVATALREAWEEVGLAADRVEILGRLNEDRTFVTDYHIAPIVGWVVDPPPEWRLDEREIEATLEIPLDEIVATDPAGWLEFTAYGQQLRAPRFEFRDGTIVWGASARILIDLQQRLRNARTGR
ncbi:MAG: NUDIX hydrolase [Myxococcota bacterium]